MATESSRINIVEAALVCGLAGAIGHLLISAGQPLTDSWVTVVGPSKIIAAALLTGFSVWLYRALRHGTFAIVAVAPISVAMGMFTPIEYWSVVLFGWGLWSAFMRSAVASTLIALGAVGLHIALVGERLPGLLSLALYIDTAVAVAFIELTGGAVDARGTTLVVDGGISLRLIGPCSSIWPMLAITGAVGTVAGALGTGAATRTYLAIGLGALASMCLNGLRLAIMGTSMGAYEWLHAGAGATAFRLLILATMLVSFVIIVLGRKPAVDESIPTTGASREPGIRKSFFAPSILRTIARKS